MGSEENIVDQLFEKLPFRQTCLHVDTIAKVIVVMSMICVVSIGLTSNQEDARTAFVTNLLVTMAVCFCGMSSIKTKYENYTRAVGAWIQNNGTVPSVAQLQHKKKISIVDAFRHAYHECTFPHYVIAMPGIAILYVMAKIGISSGFLYGIVICISGLVGLFIILKEMRMNSRKIIIRAVEKIHGYPKALKQKYKTKDGEIHVVYFKN